MAENNFDAQLFLNNYKSQRERKEIRPSAGFSADTFLHNYRAQKGVTGPATAPAPQPSTPGGAPFGQMVTDPSANPLLNITTRNEPTEQPDRTETAAQEGLTVRDRLSRLNQSWELGMAAAQQRMTGAVQSTGEVLAENLDPVRNQARELFGLEPVQSPNLDGTQELNQIAEQTVREITKDFQPMQSGDVKGILSGVQYAGEMISQSAPAMFGTFASGPLAPLFAATNMSGEAHDELLEATPEMSQEQRVAVSWGAGTAMASLELLGLGTVFRGVTPGTVSRLAIEGGLTDFLQKRGVKAAAARVLQAGIAEGSTELLQEGILMTTGAASGGEYGREQVAERLREAFFGGAAAGGGIRTGVEALTGTGRSKNTEELADVGGITDEDLGIDGPTPELPAPPGVLALPAPPQQALPSPEQEPPSAPILMPNEASGSTVYVGSGTKVVRDDELVDLGPGDYSDVTPGAIPGAGVGGNAPVNTPTNALLNPPDRPSVGGSALSTQMAEIGYTYAGPKAGTVKGGVYRDEMGDPYVVKEYNDDNQAVTEDLVNRFFSPTKTPFTQVLELPNGKKVFSSYQIPNGVLDPFDPNNKQHRMSVQEDFVKHAWLANWDVVGQDFDNVGMVGGLPKYFDFGGALNYRAQGKKKSSVDFSHIVKELETLRDPSINPQAAKVFKEIDEAQILYQIGTLAEEFWDYSLGALNNNTIAIITGSTLPQLQKAKLVNTLNKRMKFLLEYAKKSMQGPTVTFYEGTPQASTAVAKPYDQVVNSALKYTDVSHDIIYSYQDDQVVSAVLKDPHITALNTSPAYKTWSLGNKLWWDPQKLSMAFGDFQEGWLPGILFHGTKMNPVWDEQNRMWKFFPMFDPTKKGTGSGGNDTSLGMFLTENPKIAAGWGKGGQAYKLQDWANYREHLELTALSKVEVIPLTTNFKNPLIYDYNSASWSGMKNKQLGEYAVNNGHDALITLNVNDGGGKQTQIIVFEPSAANLKSPFSQTFDPTINSFYSSIGVAGKSKHTLTQTEYAGLKEEMKKLGLADVELRVFAPGTHGRAQAITGRSKNGLFIGLATEMDSEAGYQGELRHEAIHALKELGLFDTRQGKRKWNTLVDEVKRAGIPQDIQENYQEDMWIEEAIARMASLHKQSPQRGVLGRALDSVVNFFRAFRNWARGNGFQTAEGVLNYITGGSLETMDWSAAEKKRDLVDSTIEEYTIAASKIMGKKANTAKADYYNKLVRHGWNVIQLAKKNTHIPWLQEYVQRAAQWHAEKSRWMSQADETVRKWNVLDSNMQDQLAAFMFDIEQMKYRTPKEVQNGVVRKPTRQEFQSLARAHKLNREAAQVYTQVRSDFDTFLKEIEQVAMNEIARAYPTNAIVRNLEQAKAKKEFDQLRARPYFPHARFGLFTIVVKDAKNRTVYMEAFDKIKDRNRAVSSIKKKFPKDHKVSPSQLSEEGAIFQGMPHTLLTQLKKNLSLTPKQQADLEQLLVQASPANSFKNHFARRKDTAGYSTDALRAYSDYFWHGANHIARIKYKPLLEQNIQDGKNDISQTYNEGDVDTTKRVQINDHLSRHLDSIMNPENDWAGLRSAGFLWWLGFNVKSAVLNFTQVPMVSYTYLGSIFNGGNPHSFSNRVLPGKGDAQAAIALTKAMKELQGLFRTPEKIIAQHNPADGKLIDLGIKMGFLDESFAMELAGLAEGSNLLSRRAKTRARKMWIGFNHAAGAMFQGVEKINRRVTFMAAIDMARNNPNTPYLDTLKKQNNLLYDELIQQQGLPPSEAMAFIVGRDAVNSTQFEYSSWARPAVMEGKVKSTVLTFFMFTQNMLWFIQNSPGNTRYLAMLLLFAGIKGLPGAEDLEELAKGIGAQLHKDWDMEKELREHLVEMMGPDGPDPDLFLNGISRYGFGLPLLSDMTGLPLPSVDMSANISMGSPLPVVSPTLQAFGHGMQGKDFNDTFAEMAQESAGPTLGIPVGIAETVASDSYSWKDPKRWEPAVPAAVAGLSKAWRYYNEGGEKMRGGAQLLEYDKEDPVHMAEMIAQAFGFNTTRKSQAWDEQIMKWEAGQFWLGRRGLLLTQFDRARQKSPEDVRAVRAAINRYNKQVPHRDLAISRDTLLRSSKARDRSREKQEAGQPNANMLRPIYREIEELHPNRQRDKEPPSERTESAPSGR